MYVRSQTNGLPNHCYASPLEAPVALDIDYEARWMAPVVSDRRLLQPNGEGGGGGPPGGGGGDGGNGPPDGGGGGDNGGGMSDSSESNNVTPETQDELNCLLCNIMRS